MNILVINAGSSSLKYQVIKIEEEKVIAKGLCERIGIKGSKLTLKVPGRENYEIETPMENHKVAVKLVMDALVDTEHGVLKNIDEIDAIGHRVLHGGTIYSDSIVVNDDVKKVIRECFDLGPLHNPANLTGIEACEAAMPGKPNVAVFDTAFGMAMPEKAYTYAIPHEYLDKYGIRKYGFHGTSHNFVSHEAIKFGNLKSDAKVIVCHMGNGASVSASIGGKCVDTSMGLTPLEGLIMGTRCGDVDAAVAQYICNKENKSINDVLNIFNKESGILGMSGGVSSDFRDVQKAADEGNHLAGVALEAFAYRVAKYIGSYTAAMNGVDAIVFTAGVGENDGTMRANICEYLGFLGVKLNSAENKKRGEEVVISSDDSNVKVMVIPTNEELMIARETSRLAK